MKIRTETLLFIETQCSEAISAISTAIIDGRKLLLQAVTELVEAVDSLQVKLSDEEFVDLIILLIEKHLPAGYMPESWILKKLIKYVLVWIIRSFVRKARKKA